MTYIVTIHYMHIKAYIKSEILPCLIIWHRLIWFTNLRKKSLSRTNQGCTVIYPGMCPYGTQPGLNNCMYKKVKKKNPLFEHMTQINLIYKGKKSLSRLIEGVRGFLLVCVPYTLWHSASECMKHNPGLIPVHLWLELHNLYYPTL